VRNAVEAQDRGADVFTRTRCAALDRQSDHWAIQLEIEGAESRIVKSRTIVNAAGPWISKIASMIAPNTGNTKMRLVKGSHLVVGKLYDGDQAYTLQNSDDRIIFVIPYERDFSLIRTTDVVVSSPERPAQASEEEAAYLLELVNDYFERPVEREDIVWSYSGILPDRVG
jgi:glycerol-3-phosphate dehydrogenase